MGKITAILLTLTALSIGAAAARAQSPLDMLPTGKKITLPPLGTTFPVGSLPKNMILSPDGRFVITTDLGFREKLWALRTSDGVGVSHIDFDNTPPLARTYGLYYGLAFGPDGTLYAAQGGNDTIATLSLASDGTLTQKSDILTRKKDFPTGLATDQRGYLYVANNDPNTFAQPCSLAVYNTKNGAEVGRFSFGNSFYGTPNFPLSVATLTDGSKTYVSSQRDGAVYVLNTTDPANPTPITTLPTGAHPVGLRFNKAQTRLFVANAHSDTVSVVSTASDKILRTILLRPWGALGLAGVTPTDIALSPDEKTLYVPLGDMNAVAVVDTARYRLRGYIPVGWYPSAAVVSPDGARLLVANAKGVGTRYPNAGYQEYTANLDRSQYGLNLMEGVVQTIPVPVATPRTLVDYTLQVLGNNHITPLTDNPSKNPLAGLSREAGKIEHVIYIVKENRTYDQILGDLPQGNGDANLALFPRDVTPNQHALAERFVLLDNFYVCGEASGDGWPWSTQAMANEYVIKNLPYNYSGRGRNYDFEGQNNGYPTGGFPAADPDGNPLSTQFPNGLPAIPDVAEAPGGHLWDLVAKNNLSYRNWGFFYTFGVQQGDNIVIPDNYPASEKLRPGGRDLAGISDLDFRRYDNDYADSDAPKIHFDQSGDPNCLPSLQKYGKYEMPSRFSEWKREFDQMLDNDPSGKSVPNLMMVRFNRDHTQGLSAGKQSPRAEVADNDYAVGQLVEAVSKSAIWKNTLIVVLEDDAQAGPDHVDFHRSVCFVVSPWVQKSRVDHTFYNTNSALRSMELVLNLPPMNQYDAVATPFGFFDDAPANDAPFTAILPAQAIVCERNPSAQALQKMPANDPLRKLVEQSATIKLDTPDSMGASTQLFNQIIWKSVRGVHSVMPAPITNGLPHATAPHASVPVMDKD